MQRAAAGREPRGVPRQQGPARRARRILLAPARLAAVYARNEECGLRCLYHGWKFDVEGNVVEMASEPADSNIPQRVKHKAYPAREAARVLAYMGPPSKA